MKLAATAQRSRLLGRGRRAFGFFIEALYVCTRKTSDTFSRS
jgi:hypothetical protein